MDVPDVTLEGVARTVGYLLLGAVGTALLAVGLLPAAQPLQGFVYDAFYLAVGPWTATVAATVLAFTLVSLVAASVPTLLAAYNRSRTRSRNRDRDRDGGRSGGEAVALLAGGLAGGILAIELLLAASAYVGAVGFLAAIVAFGAFVVGVPLGLRFLGIWPGGVAAFAGGVPVLAVLLLALGFGLGWGGGYDLVAREVPASAVNGSVEADLSEVPEVRDDLLAPAGDVYATCEEDREGRRTCRLPLRGYEHEARAARFLDRHGVRCPFLDAPAANGTGNRSFLAEDDGTYYRVSCVAYGD